VQWIIIGVRQMEHRWKRFHQLATHVAGELVGAAEEHRRFRITGVLIVGMLRSELVWGQAEGGGAVGDAVVETTADERDVARGELACRLWVIEPQPGMTPHDGVNGKLDGAGQAQPPRGPCD
jgi:hypothetical protein